MLKKCYKKHVKVSQVAWTMAETVDCIRSGEGWVYRDRVTVGGTGDGAELMVHRTPLLRIKTYGRNRDTEPERTFPVLVCEYVSYAETAEK